MDRDTSWRRRLGRRFEAGIGLAALVGSAWMFSTMSEATTMAAQRTPTSGPAAPVPAQGPAPAAAVSR